jgi:hypothetical protein
VKQFRFRAVINLDPLPADRSLYDTTGRRELLHTCRLNAPEDRKILRVLIFADGDEPAEAGEAMIATLTVTDDEALSYLAAGQLFTLWGPDSGHGVISRRVFTDQGPS